MKTDRKLSRRSFLGRVVGGTVAGGAFVALASRAEALQVSDSDSGPNSDPPGRGRTGVTDSDSGPNSDRPNHGRSRSGRPCTDSDTGPNADRAGSGRGNGRSDSDPTDRAGCARR
jgi:hypothetical protein